MKNVNNLAFNFAEWKLKVNKKKYSKKIKILSKIYYLLSLTKKV